MARFNPRIVTFSDLFNIDDSQFSDRLIRPEGDELVTDQDELDLASGFIRLKVIADLGRAFGKLVEQPDQFRCRTFDSDTRKAAALDERTGSYGWRSAMPEIAGEL
ncbi:MAG: hypothetical protein CFE26_01390 [Verrucomicrobiales bacterium VVV1]|nr:MAG: hypothetical protein CFE26_01390 [Verrucomicrobiales bacterium VVV1]